MTNDWIFRDLTGLSVTQLKFDFRLHIHMWSLQRSLMVTLGATFTIHWSGDRVESFDPEKMSSLGELLKVFNCPVSEFRASRQGQCILVFADGVEIHCQPHPQYEAWESEGTGDLESVSLLCGVGGGSPWV